MNEDLKFFRRRWWGFYVLVPVILLCQIPLVHGSIQNISEGNYVGALVGFMFLGVCLLLCFGLYAPLTCFFAFRIIGLVVFIGYVAYAVDCLQAGALFSSKRSEISFINAILGLFLWGLPGLFLFFKLGDPSEPADYEEDSEQESEMQTEDED